MHADPHGFERLYDASRVLLAANVAFVPTPCGLKTRLMLGCPEGLRAKGAPGTIHKHISCVAGCGFVEFANKRTPKLNPCHVVGSHFMSRFWGTKRSTPQVKHWRFFVIGPLGARLMNATC